ncbi:MAG: AprI/Inh family metalloprotease inhibitor [Methylocystis sp.]|uniref:AprI/Inh family metalloprotease inhibitor n=1 Tax=Methylocystis sp. TaxID=1911079 RepID=UPI00395B9370
MAQMAIFFWRRIYVLGFCLTVAGLTAPLALAAGPSDVAGRYSILREGDKDTGCMLTLDARVRGRAGLKAQLAPACRDNGVVIFDPVGWGIDQGRLVVTARKGHKAHFDKDAAGVWRRDGKEGKALGLRPL